MSTDEKNEAFLARWSRRKQEQEQKIEAEPAGEKPVPALPPVESLTPEADFSGFMHPKVQDALRRVALKKLFSDPHFNVADPFEAYSGDWTVGEPIPEEMLAALNQAQRLLFSDKQGEPKREEGQEQIQQAKPDEPGNKDA